MAPVFATPSPTSRRTRRRQERQRQRCHRQQQFTEKLWNQSSNEQPASQPKDWLEMNAQDQKSADAAWIRPQATGFNPSIIQSTHSNPFSVLDVGIPSPTLSIPKSTFLDNSEQHDPINPDVYGVGISTVFSVQTPDTRVSKKTRRDDWASDLQKEGLIRNPLNSKVQNKIAFPVATVVASPQIQVDPTRKEPSSSNGYVASTAASNFRVPSPLLYHRRSCAVASNSADSEQHNDGLEFTHTRLMSEIRSKTQQLKHKASAHSQEGAFVAAKLPLMGSTAISEDSTDQEVQSNITAAADKTTKQSLPPILTTTNVYLCPQRLYQIFDCASVLGSSQPSMGLLNSLWLPDENLVFPTLTVSGQLPICNSDPVNIYGDLPAPVQHPQSAHVDDLSTHLLDSRDRSSTQDSLDRDFTVAEAVLTATSKSKSMNPLMSSRIGMEPNSRGRPSHVSIAKHWCDTALTETEDALHSKGSIAESQSTVVFTKRQEKSKASVDNVLLLELDDDDDLNEVNLSRDDVISSEDEWVWADDQWQSDVTTPQSIDGSQGDLSIAGKS